VATAAPSSRTVGWFPALNPTALTLSGSAKAPFFLPSAANSYPPAGAYAISPIAMDFIVTGTAVSVAEPGTAILFY
jgi:hypothetical protein